MWRQKQSTLFNGSNLMRWPQDKVGLDFNGSMRLMQLKMWLNNASTQLNGYRRLDSKCNLKMTQLNWPLDPLDVNQMQLNLIDYKATWQIVNCEVTMMADVGWQFLMLELATLLDTWSHFLHKAWLGVKCNGSYKRAGCFACWRGKKVEKRLHHQAIWSILG